MSEADDLREALRVLRLVEWGAEECMGFGTCPVCGCMEQAGIHGPRCALGALLARFPEEKSP